MERGSRHPGERVAFVTGAGSGIGRAAAMRFAETGAAVVVVDLDESAAEVTAALLASGGGKALAITADISDAASVEGAVAEAVAKFGRIDWALNNAGVTGGSPGPDDWDDSLLARALAVNVSGTWLCMKYQVAQMLTQGGGAIVNIASVAGLIGIGGFAYAASKHAIVGLTRVAGARYAAQGIRINAVCPGSVQTPMLARAESRTPGLLAGLAAGNPIGRLGEPCEIADAAFWLCSDRSSYVIGQAITVDGGYTVV